jgi:hypothetical protein
MVFRAADPEDRTSSGDLRPHRSPPFFREKRLQSTDMTYIYTFSMNFEQLKKVPPHIRELAARDLIIKLEQESELAGEEEIHFSIHYVLCPICGAATVEKKVERKNNFALLAVVAEEFGELCSGCQSISLRHPEVFRWITRVLQFHLFSRHGGHGSGGDTG